MGTYKYEDLAGISVPDLKETLFYRMISHNIINVKTFLMKNVGIRKKLLCMRDSVAFLPQKIGMAKLSVCTSFFTQNGNKSKKSKVTNL